MSFCLVYLFPGLLFPCRSLLGHMPLYRLLEVVCWVKGTETASLTWLFL